ncbi:hypothetical protein BDD12DRAFT_12690 [Trichophaea hybrida]|nr:hypothetical protein BDD12DRAFT_12690 [Trichophaea hybrida]
MWQALRCRYSYRPHFRHSNTRIVDNTTGNTQLITCYYTPTIKRRDIDLPAGFGDTYAEQSMVPQKSLRNLGDAVAHFASKHSSCSSAVLKNNRVLNNIPSRGVSLHHRTMQCLAVRSMGLKLRRSLDGSMYISAIQLWHMYHQIPEYVYPHPLPIYHGSLNGFGVPAVFCLVSTQVGRVTSSPSRQKACLRAAKSLGPDRV